MNANAALSNLQRDSVTCGSDIRTWWKRRSKFERKLVCSLIIVALLLFALVLFIIIREAVTPRKCHTTGCLLAASQIVTHVDPLIDPCDNFFKFACGKFIEQSHGDIKASSILKMEELVDSQVAEITQEPIKDDENYWIKSQKALFQACMNQTAVEEESLEIFKKILENLHGRWPVLAGSQWRGDYYFDWKELVYNLRDRGLHYNMMLNVVIMPDPIDNDRNIVRVFAPRVNTVKPEHKEFYKKYMSDVAVIFGADPNRAISDMEKVFGFMEDLKKVSDKNNLFDTETDMDYTEANATDALLAVRFTVHEFQSRHKDIDWLDFINRILSPEAKISADDYVLFPNTEFTEAFLNLLNQKNNKRIQANYMVWVVIEQLIEYLSKELRQREASYSCLTGKSVTKKKRFKFCESRIMDRYHFRPLDVLYARKFLPAKRREKVKDIVENVRSEFIAALEKSSWMDNESKNNAVDKARATVEIVGAPGDYFSNVFFEQLLTENEFQKTTQNDSFLTMLLNYNKLHTDALYYQIYFNVSNTKLDPFYRYITKVNAMYSLLDNVMIIPVGILQGVFYDVNRPMYLNYGAIGSIIGHELTHGFGERGSHFDKDGNKNSIWTNATLEAFKKKTECIIQEAEDFPLDNTNSSINGTLTLEENVADYTGIIVSYAAYKKWVRRNGQEPQLPEIDYTPNQLFWISAVAYECFEFNPDGSSKVDRVHADNAFRVLGPLRNNLDFARDFNCPVGSKMNPHKKCQIF